MNKINLDIEKVKEEDRRYLMSRSLNIASTNATNRITNTSLMIAFSSISVAVFSLVYAIQKSFTEIVLSVLVIESLFLVIIFWWYFTAQKTVNKQKKAAEEGHNLIFKKHFKYAKKK